MQLLWSNSVLNVFPFLTDAGVHPVVVSVIVTISVENKAVGVEGLLAQHHGQVLVEGDVLDQGDVDGPRLLEQRLVPPVGIEAGQLLNQPVVVPVYKRKFSEGIFNC